MVNDTDSPTARWRQLAPESVLLDGFHALKHALRFGTDIRAVLTSDRAAVAELAGQLADDVAARVDALAVEIPAAALRELVPRVHPTGVVALAARPARAANLARLARQPRRAPVVLLDNPRNLGNVGAVVRLAAGFGATGVATTGDTDPWHPTVVRAGAGLHFATAVEQVTLDQLSSGPLYALDPEGEDIRGLTFPDAAVLAFGSERHGISPELRARADHLVAIPMQPQVSSFNLATSVGMGLFHWMSRREA
ncbi:TrmH family RNA methyltransferase [Streptacidiphilus sp. PB12-B1b]|uniref:TrmH family RNA methyltransferase n=1 Tax=Streptacidiphilus sp. PB12-B1b TaxID=2705012 RepID=UPI0015F9FA0D|nr:TrmH family RNA methyltransferase [Streptacidiphilus sp. PB12-B1b]QMU79908.1 TrmH family RNA methyltransferase [Streptacidiphilus sp. PB12-B1b]